MKAQFINPFYAEKYNEYEHVVYNEAGEIIDRRHAKFSKKTTDAEMAQWSDKVVQSLALDVKDFTDLIIDKPVKGEVIKRITKL